MVAEQRIMCGGNFARSVELPTASPGCIIYRGALTYDAVACAQHLIIECGEKVLRL